MKLQIPRLKFTTPERLIVFKRQVTVFTKRRPLTSFFIILGALLVLIILSNLINRPQPPSEETTTVVKSVDVYQVGSTPKITVQAQVEKSGVIRIVALTSGVVNAIHKKEGEFFNEGETLISLSTNYQGGNALSLQRKIAQTQYNNLLKTFPLQQEIIQKQKELAEKTDTNNDRLREITAQSLEETRTLISLNEDILRTVEDNIRELEENNQNGQNDDLILASKQLRSQFLSATNAQRQALRNAEYQSGGDNPPAQLSNLQREIAIKQLELQEKTLSLNKEIARLQLQLARVNEGIMFPSAPFPGTVQRVLVKVGETVQPGRELMIVAELPEYDPIIAIAYLPNDLSRKVSQLEPSTLHIADFTYTAYPYFISTEAIQGTLYGVYFPIPDNYTRYVTEDGYIQIDIPIGYYDTSATNPYLPIDAVYQTQDESYIFVVAKDRAVSRKVTVGQVYGSFVEITQGLSAGDRVILDRTVINGDRVNIR